MEIDSGRTTPQEVQDALVAVNHDGEIIVPDIDESEVHPILSPESTLDNEEVPTDAIPVEEPPYDEEYDALIEQSEATTFNPKEPETWSTTFKLTLKRIEDAIAKADRKKWVYPYLNGRKVDGAYVSDIDYLSETEQSYLNDILTKRRLAQTAMHDLSE